MDREPDRCEVKRLTDLLQQVINLRGVSIRSLEKKMGVGNSVYQKVLSGKVTMTLGHLFQILEALELDRGEFFREAYPPPSQTAEAPAAESEVPAAESDELEQKMIDLLHRLGLLPKRTDGNDG